MTSPDAVMSWAVAVFISGFKKGYGKGGRQHLIFCVDPEMAARLKCSENEDYGYVSFIPRCM